MKPFFYSLILFITISLCTNAQSKREKQVETAVETLKKALLEGKREQLEAIAAEQLTYGHSGGKLENKAEFVEALASGKSDFLSIELTDQTIEVSGKTAIVRHKLSAQTNDSGVPGNVNLYVLLVFQKQGTWKLLARQAVKLPK
ncbi:nuclear transport factor 2 family protein [Desertivirga xinjiangensis]|uniref:nuclear transport factor 2 family protein n=1 Tax=Desertivirga xinjiangensis TaxID=539206 RepID=UPI0021092427|nr:nuclear transport factor 2 family protein [Pedobacter xinjiangensis]